MNRDELYRIWKAEKNEKNLQRLSSSFYAEVKRLLNDCRAYSAAAGQDRTQKAISDREFEILQRLSRELAAIRMEKIIDAALSREEIEIERLAQEEAEFAKVIATHIRDYYHFIDELAPEGLKSEEKAASKPAQAALEVVRFLSAFPAIVGVDLKTYGPFKSEDIATLPAENASALISQGVVKQVRFSEGTTSPEQSRS